VVRLLRTIALAIYSRQRQYITVQRVGTTGSGSGPEVGRKVHCATLSSLESVDAIAHHLPADFRDSAEQLKNRVANGCVLTLAFTHSDTGSLAIVGYELAERGVFSALGRRQPAPADAVFSHWAEVLPAYRGQRIHALLFAARDTYFLSRGATFVWGVVVPKNRASLQALRRAGSFVVGTVTRVSILCGFLVWETPVERIARILELLSV
jgi:hypothetical protein